MNDSVSILVAVFLILIALRWMLGGNQGNAQQQRRATTTARRPQHRVTPQSIERVRAIFPNIPVAAIQADLQRTGNVDTTVENALRDGGLPLPPQAAQPVSPNPANGTRKSPSHPNLVQRYKIDVKEEVEDVEPPKVWESSPDKRQEMLKKRKEFMVLQARKKLLEQQEKKKKEAEKEAEKEFDEMNVEELNSLSPEQRRDHMLQALQKRS